MDTTRILQNSWSLMLRYRALWIFGTVLALTTVSFGSSFWLSHYGEPADKNPEIWEISARDQAWIKENFGLDLPLSYTLKAEDLTVRLDDPALSGHMQARLINIAIGVILAFSVLLVITLVLRYTAGTALIIMVNDQQDRHEIYKAREGWSLGFSKDALELFLIDLVVIPLLITLSLLLVLLALFPLSIVISGSPIAITVGLLLMLSLLLVSAAAVMVMWIVGMVTQQLAYRACCLEGLGVFASIWRGIRLMRLQLRGVGLTWLVITGLDLIYPILVAPVAILLVAGGLAVGGVLTLILGALLTLVLAKATAWTIAVVAGLVLLVLVIAVPMTLLDGLREVFKSSTWTLTFREAVSQQSLESAPAGQPALPQVGAA